MSKAMERVRDAQAAYREAEGTPDEAAAYASLVAAVDSVPPHTPSLVEEPRCTPGYCAAADELDAIQPQTRSR